MAARNRCRRNIFLVACMTVIACAMIIAIIIIAGTAANKALHAFTPVYAAASASGQQSSVSKVSAAKAADTQSSDPKSSDPQPAVVTGLMTSLTATDSTGTLTDTITIKPAYGRTVKLQYFDSSSGKWVTTAKWTVGTKSKASLKVKYTNEWKEYVYSKYRVAASAVSANKKKKRPAMAKYVSPVITVENQGRISTYEKTSITGVDKSISKSYTNTITDSVTVEPAYGRKVQAYIKNENTGKWVKKKTFTTENKAKATVKITYPSNWKNHYSSSWKIVAPSVTQNLDSSGKVTSDQGKTVKVRTMPSATVKTIKLKNSVGNMGAGIVMDENGNVIYDRNATKKMSPASMSKMMTSILIEEKIAGKNVKITSAAKKEIDGLWPGGHYDSYSSGNVIKGADVQYAMMLPSANIVAISAGHKISKTTKAFASLMNEKAKAIGCSSTTVYKNASGLEGDGTNNGKGNWSTAYDQALIGRYIMTKSSLKNIRTVVKASSHTVHYYTSSGGTLRSRTVYNTNPCLGERGCVGLKTGTEIVAGNCFCGAFEYKGKTYITVVMQAGSKRTDTFALYDYMKYSLEHGIKNY